MAFDPEILTPAPDGNTLVFTASGLISGELLIADRLPMIRGIDYTVAAAQITFLPAAYPLSPTPGAPPPDTLLRLFRQVAPAFAGDDADVCNQALFRCGSSVKIVSLVTDNTKEARIAASFYAMKRDLLLAMYDWSFARGHAELAESADTARDEWEFIYDAPADMLVMRRVWNGQRWSRPEDEAAFDTEGNLTGPGTVLLSDYSITNDAGATVLPCQYTRALTDASRFPAYFTNALASFLAQDFIVPLAVSVDVAAKIDARFEKEFALAVALDARQRQRAPDRPESSFVSARGGRRAPPDPRWPWP